MLEVLGYFALIFFCILAILFTRGLASRRRRLQDEQRKVMLHTVSHRPSRAAPSPSIHHTRSSPPRENIRQAHQQLLATLPAAQVTFVTLLRHRAIDLYRTQYGTSWEEAARAVDRLEPVPGEEDALPSITFQQGTDPLVTALLLQAGCRDDALTYFRQSSGATLEEAEEAIDFMQSRVDENNWAALREDLIQASALDLASLQFLLNTGNRSLAIQYYRERTDTAWFDAYKAVEELSRQTSGQMYDN